MEKWKTVKGFSNYEVSNYGNIRSKDPYHKRKGKRAVRPWSTESGYLVVQLCEGLKRRKVTTVGRLVAQAFVSNPDPKAKIEVNHKNCNKEDNFYLNLEWCTPSENIQHAYHNNRMPYRGGSNCYLSKLTEEQVREIRQNYRGNKSYKEIGERYGVGEKCISRIIRKETWKHVK